MRAQSSESPMASACAWPVWPLGTGGGGLFGMAPNGCFVFVFFERKPQLLVGLKVLEANQEKFNFFGCP